jgi:hypothetical protein
MAGQENQSPAGLIFLRGLNPPFILVAFHRRYFM